MKAIALPSGTQPHEGSSARTVAFGFQENKGQVRTTTGTAAADVRYHLARTGTSIFLLSAGIAYQFEHAHRTPRLFELIDRRVRSDAEQAELDSLMKKSRRETFRMDMYLEGADPHARVTAESALPGTAHFYTHGVTDVHSFGRVTYHDVYPGIDWVVYLRGEGIKYDFMVHPGADPGAIRLHFTHHEELYLDEPGRLVHGNRMGRFVEDAPISFQGERSVPTRFVLQGDQL